MSAGSEKDLGSTAGAVPLLGDRTQWIVAPGDPTFVFVPGIVKPIACGSKERARLIAAAPELKEALQNMLGAFDNAVRRMKMPGDFEDEAIATARIALAKTQPPAKAGEAKQ